MQTVRIQTLGCSKNRVDSEHILSQLEGLFEILPEDSIEPVDYLLLNTCGFILDAKEESVNAILAAAQHKVVGEVGKLYVFGCLSERYKEELPALIPEVDGWFGARDYSGIYEALGVVPDESKICERHLTTPSHYAFLKISEGCDRRCSYCAIPHIRGAHRSVPLEELLDEAEMLAAKGVRELIVIAQDTSYYGLDLYGRRALGELLQKLSEIEGIEWIRLHYSYPADFPEDVLDLMARNPKICPYMDIPLQHISDRVLDNMHRHVTGEQTRELIRKMREKVPGIVLRTTMMVGHPGERRKEFMELLDFVKEARFERLGAFTYSEEEGTWGAAHLKDTVSPVTKRSRMDRLMKVQSKISLDYNLSRVGTVEKVIIDAFSDGVFECRSRFESPEVDGEILAKPAASCADPYSLIGTFAEVRITGADEYDLIAEFINNHEN